MTVLRSLGHVGIAARNTDEWAVFATEILGMQLGGRGHRGHLSFRMEPWLSLARRATARVDMAAIPTSAIQRNAATMISVSLSPPTSANLGRSSDASADS